LGYSSRESARLSKWTGRAGHCAWEAPNVTEPPTIVERFRVWARDRESSIAIRTDSISWTYRELDALSDRVAVSIDRTAGTGNVAIACADPCWIAAALLGAIKANRVWTLVDLQAPAKRNASIVEDSRAELILTDTDAGSPLGNRCGVRMSRVDRIEASVTSPVASPLAGPSDPACILYTSGSSGAPKGVIHSHRSLAHIIERTSNVTAVTAEDRIALVLSGTHIAGLTDMLRALCGGAQLVVCDLRRQVQRMAAWLEENDITVFHAVPTLFRHALASFRGNLPTCIRLVHLGGEPIARGDVELFQTRFAEPARLLCGYGTTETGMICRRLIEPDSPVGDEQVSAGCEVEGMRVLFLDEAGQPAADASGEIAVASDFLPLGYWRRDELTHERFVRLPGPNGLRVYRTGDVGRRLDDGRVVVAGRNDNQLKIKGQRVEPEEVEIALRRVRGVREAVVGMGEEADQAGLRAYYITDDPTITGSEIRAALVEWLPPGLVPTRFIRCERFPLMPSGKVDRRALCSGASGDKS